MILVKIVSTLDEVNSFEANIQMSIDFLIIYLSNTVGITQGEY